MRQRAPCAGNAVPTLDHLLHGGRLARYVLVYPGMFDVLPRIRLALLALALFGCGARPQVATTDRVQLVAVRIEGNRAVDADALLEGLALSEARERGAELEPYLVEIDRERVRGYYLRHGYFEVDVRSRLREHAGRAEVTFVVDEGPRARLRQVVLTGLPDDPRVSAEQLRALVVTADGAPFDYAAYEQARPRLIAALDAAGYAHATVEARVLADRARAEAVIRLDVAPGPLCTLGPVTLVGVGGPLADAARARVELSEGARYSSTDLQTAQATLDDMGRFATVRVTADRGGDAAVIPVTIELHEADRHELRLGGGLGIDPESYEVHGRAAYQVAGWPTALTTSRLELRPAYTVLRAGWEQAPQLEVLSSIERLDLFRPRLRGEVEASFAYRTIEAYTSVGPRLRLGLRSPIGRRVELRAGWQLEWLTFRRLDPALDAATIDALRLDDSYLLGFHDQAVALDLRDDPVAPRLGVYASLVLEEGGRFAGGEVTYLRTTPELRGYLPLGPLVFAARGRLGMIAGEAPVTRRFLAGGASSQRGFPVRRLAPTVTGVVDGEERSVVIGGAGLLELGGEVRAPLGRLRGLDLGGVLFADGADVTERAGDLDPARLHWAVGAGLRIATVIGPVRLDVGYRVNRTGAGELRPGERLAYHLNLGEAF